MQGMKLRWSGKGKERVHKIEQYCMNSNAVTVYVILKKNLIGLRPNKCREALGFIYVD